MPPWPSRASSRYRSTRTGSPAVNGTDATAPPLLPARGPKPTGHLNGPSLHRTPGTTSTVPTPHTRYPWTQVGISERRYYKLLPIFAQKVNGRYESDYDDVVARMKAHLNLVDKAREVRAVALEVLRSHGFGDEGVRVVAAARNITPELKATGATGIPVGLSTADGPARLVEQAVAELSGIDVLVNNVGGGDRTT